MTTGSTFFASGFFASLTPLPSSALASSFFSASFAVSLAESFESAPFSSSLSFARGDGVPAFSVAT